MRYGTFTLLVSLTVAISAHAGRIAGEGKEGRGIGEFDIQQQQQQQLQNGGQFQQQTQLQQMQQQVLQFQQQGQALTQKKSSGRGAEESGQAAQAAQESIKTATEKQGEELKSKAESFLGGITPPKDEGVKSDVGAALKQLSTPVASGALTEIARGIITDIQALNATQVAYITKIAEQFTAPPRAAPVAQRGTSLSSQVAASGLNPSSRPGNIFAEALNQNSPVQVPQHTGNGFMESRSVSPGVMRGISSETIYNVPTGISLHE